MKRIFSLILAFIAVQMMWAQSSDSPEINLTLENYYVKADGDGDGSSWAKAMNGESLHYVLSQKVTGATFHLAEGEYDWSLWNTKTKFPLYGSVTIIGGYDSDNHTYNPSKNITKISNAPFEIYGENSDADFKGIHFDESYIRVQAENVNLDVENCYFTQAGQALNHDRVVSNISHASSVSTGNIKLVNDTFDVYHYSESYIYNYLIVSSRGDSLVIDNCCLRGNARCVSCSGKSNIIKNSSLISAGDVVDCGAGELYLINNKICYDGIEKRWYAAHGYSAGKTGAGLIAARVPSTIIDVNEGCSKFVCGENEMSIGRTYSVKVDGDVPCYFYKNYFGITKDGETKLDNRTGYTIALSSNNSCVFPSDKDSSNYVNGSNYGLYLTNCSNIDIQSFYFSGNDEAVSLSGDVDNVKIHDNNFEGNTTGINIVDPADGLTVKNNIFVGNNNGITENSQRLGKSPVLIENNIFNGVFESAINLTDKDNALYKTPVISEVRFENKVFEIEGKIDTALVADIELFYNDGRDQSAIQSIGKYKTDNKGHFLITCPMSDINNISRYCFTATAIYKKGTSELSEKSCFCLKDTTFDAVSIQQGEEFLGVVYSEVGLYDSVPNLLQNSIGCDSLVYYRVFVKAPSNVEYYVKPEATGTGDGSSWKDAMSAETFAKYLPLSESSTFYVAEGTYKPIYDENLRKPSDLKDLCYVVSGNTTIIGGFPIDAKKNTRSNPEKYNTIFDGEGDHEGIIMFRLYGSLSLSGIKLRGSGYNNFGAIMTFNDNLRLNIDNSVFYENNCVIYTNNSSELTIAGCSFYSNNCSQCGPIYCKGSLTVTNSVFSKNVTLSDGSAISFLGSNLKIGNCTFSENSITSEGNGGTVLVNGGVAVIENSTFFNNSVGYKTALHSGSAISVVGGSECSLYNNTVISNNSITIPSVYVSGSSKVDMIGNIVLDNDKIDIKNGSTVTSNYNLLKSAVSSSTTDIIAPDCKIGSFMETELKDNTGETPTLALLSDTLPDGRSLRFPKKQGKVIRDQRDVSRMANMCMGAFELYCPDDTVLKYDSIYVGESFNGVKYDKVGVYEGIYTPGRTETGCYAIINHILFVKPDPTVKLYYVKENRVNDGTGRNWKNAMSGEDFLLYVSLAPDGTTFYVAEGTYRPYHGVSYLSNRYEINSNVKIIGGFPRGSQGGENSEPDKYITRFDGDFGKNDAVELTEDEYEGKVWDFQNYGDNSYELFYSYTNRRLNVSFDGVTFSNTRSAIYASSKNVDSGVDLHLNNVKFERVSQYSVYNSSSIGSVDVDNSVFSNSNGNCIFAPDVNVRVTNSSFLKNHGGFEIIYTSSDLCEMIYLDNISVSGCSSNFVQSYGDLIIKNSSFDSNEFNSFITQYSAPEYKFHISNTSITNNKTKGSYFLYSYSTDNVTIDSCLIDHNESASYLGYFSSMKMTDSKVSNNSTPTELFYVNKMTDFVGDTISNNKSTCLLKSYGGISIDSCIVNDNESYLIYSQSGDPYSITNSIFEDNVGKNIYQNNAGLFDIKYANKQTELIIRNSKFIGNEAVGYFIYGTLPYTISECLFENNKSGSYFIGMPSGGPTTTSGIYNSTFNGNVSATVMIFYCCTGTYNFNNNTVTSNIVETKDYAGALLELYGPGDGYISYKVNNNTIIGNTSKNIIHQTSDPSYEGNIIFGNVCDVFNIYCSVDPKKAKNNIMPLVTYSKDDTYHLTNGTSNILSEFNYDKLTSDADYVNDVKDAKNHLEDIASLFAGSYNKTTGLFTPVLDYNGGVTPTVALKSDKLSDGTSIRFPRLYNILTDQRGAYRQDKTCMGAYEFGCSKDTVNAADTVVVGTKYKNGKIYEAVGIYDSIFVTYKTKFDCDSVVNYSLYVVPDPKIKEYYVKTSKKGTGDGSDWDNAMDPKTFAFVFENLKTEGVTFYIAEGKYHAVYDGWGKEVNNKNAHWSSKYGANIYGGYDSLSTGNASTTKANPAVYRTILTGDVKNDDNVKLDGDCGYTFENFSDNMNSSMISMEVYGDVHISGVELTGMTFSHGTSPALIRLIAKSGTEYSATIDHCKLSVADKGIEANNIRNLTVDQCEFDYVRNSAVYSNGDCKVTNSTFNHTAGINYYGNNSNLVVENSTFVKNRSDLQLYIYGTELSASAQINNNTFISCEEGSYLSIYDNVSATVSGNIFAGSEINIYKRDGEAKQQTFANNVIACKTFELGESGVDKDNIKVADITALYKILEGTYSESDGIFTPALTYKGAETRTVALLEDTLSDGTSIRFPRLENILKDQRGLSRFDETCMGAYEIGCPEDTTFAVDTVPVGTKIYGQTFTKVGVHDSIFENLVSKNGCDSIVMHKVVVRPTALNYYVKTKRVNKGDGSDWDNAMNGEDFATYLPLVPDGATFYVAAGEYKPVYDINGNVSAWPLYNVNSSISIYGGFPADATGKDVPSEPDKYKTVLGHDVNCSSALFYSDNNELLSFVLDGVYVNDYKSYVISMPSADLTIRNSYFDGNSLFCYVSNEGSLNVVNTEFSKTQNTLFSMNGTKSVYMEDVKLVDNTPSYFYGDGYDVILKSVNATNNGYYYFIGSKKLLVENSEFTKNSMGGNLFTTSGSVDIQNSLFDQNEGSMLVYSDFTYEDSYINISKSKFSNNTTSSSVVYVGGSPINCTLTESEFSNNKCYNLLYLMGSNYLSINECEFLSNNCEKSNPDWTEDPFMIQIRTSVKKVQVDSCNFISNNSPTSLFRCNCDTLDFKDCFLDKNNTDSRELLSFMISAIYQNRGKNFAYVERNTFSNNKCNYLMLLFNQDGDVYLRNNTVVSNECSREIWYPKYSDVYLENNTIVGNKCKSVSEHDFLYKSMVGNFIFGNQYEKLYRITARDIEGEPLYNVMPLTIDYLSIKVPNSTNIVSEYYIEKLLKELEDYPESDDISNVKDLSVEISSVLEGTYDPTTGIFTPVLKDNGGFTPTVALKKDVLPDGTSIRFPRLENVLTDQRGVDRLDETCMGAYEIRCTPIITELKDTVMVGDSYVFNEKKLDDVCKKVGSYYFSDTLAGAENCDSIVKLSLAVRPQKNENGYYVKVDGTGDGSDWINAMSPKDFAEFLPLVYDGETFHIAAGTYKSTYVDPELGRMYNINSSVTLIGGYPDTVMSIATPSMPDLFVTKLTADVKNNDLIYYYPNSLDINSYYKFDDNDSILIRLNGDKTLNLFGLTLSGVNSCDRGVVDLSEGSSLVMDHCTVEDNLASAVYGKGTDVQVANSVFTHNYSNNGAAFHLVDSKLNVLSSAFHENMANATEYCDVEYSKGGVASLINTEATFENSTLVNNSADNGAVFCMLSSKLDLTNNTISGNQIIPESKYKGSVISSLDDKSSVSLFGNLVIGNQQDEFDGKFSVNSTDYNVYSFKTDMSYGEHDMIMNNPKEVQMLLDGEMVYGSETIYIPKVQNNGGYTPTVAVVQSPFDGGKILNIPLDDRKVTYDQRGFVRKDSSCIGAFEFPTYTGYYVKKQAHGDGSGRDWENSMSDTTFAKYFSIVPANASFYIAEGVYTPMVDSYGKLTDEKSRRYSTSRLLNIYGGYPDSAQTGCEADPTKYKTIFSVDYNGDDKYLESTDEYSYIDALNTLDNGYYIVDISSKVPGSAEIKGIEFRGQRSVPRASSAALQVSGRSISGVNYRLEQCSFRSCYAGIYSSCDTFIIRECLFDSMSAWGVSHSSFSLSENTYLLVEKSTFANSLDFVHAYSFNGLMRVQNCTFANSLYGLTTPGGYQNTPENTRVEIYNNSFFPGKKGICGMSIYDYVPVELKGNIYASDKLMLIPDGNKKWPSIPVVSDYNVYTAEIDALKFGENDKLVEESSLEGVIDGAYNTAANHFVGRLSNNGGFADNVAVLSTLVDEETDIRFPLVNTTVTEDQNNVARMEHTCAGAYEALCKNPFVAEGQIMNESSCSDQDGGMRAIMKIFDSEGKPMEGKFSFVNNNTNKTIKKGNVELYEKGVYVLHNTGKPCDTIIVKSPDCVAVVPLSVYEPTEDEKSANIKNAIANNQTCYGINNGSIEIEYSDFHSYYDLSFDVLSLADNSVLNKNLRDPKGVVKFDSVPAGTYKVYSYLSVEGCIVEGVDTLFVDTLEITAPDKQMEILSVVPTENHCSEKYDGSAEVTVAGWIPETGQSWKYFITGGDTISGNDAEQILDDTFKIVLPNLKGGEYRFILSDACGQTLEDSFEVVDNIAKPITFEKTIVGYTCPTVSDGKITYTVSNWDDLYVAMLNGDTILPEKSEKGVATFVADGLSDSLYVLKVVNMCDEENSDSTDLYTYSLENEGFTITDVVFDADKAKCDIDARLLDVTVKGGHKKEYNFCVMTMEGDTVEYVTLDSVHFLSKTLPDGQFKVVASIPEGCVAEYDKNLIVEPTVKLTARKTEVMCGDKKSTLILTNANSESYNSDLYLLNEKGNWVLTDPISDGTYKKTITGSVSSNYTAVKSTADGCEIFAPIEEYTESEDMLSEDNLTVKLLTVNQRCFNVKNGAFKLAYSNFNSEYDLELVAHNVYTNTDHVSKGMTPDTIFLTDLDSGLYDVSIRLAIGGCALDGAERSLGQYHIEGVDSMLKIVKDSVSQSKCYSNFKATAIVYFKNWQKDIYSWNYYLDDEFKYYGKPEEIGIDTSIAIFANRGGLAKFAIFDICKDTLKREFVIDSLEKPSVEILVDSSYVDLRCAYDSGCIVVKLKGGDRSASRFYMEHQDPSHVNFFDSVPSDSMFKIYDFIEGKPDTTSPYTSDLKEKIVCRLDSGTYTVVYQNLDFENCKNDYDLDRVTIKRPAAVKLKLATNDVRCYDKAEGVVNFVPERPGRAWTKYTLANDSDKTTGSNWAKWLFLDDEAQYKKYRLRRSTKDEAHYYSGHVSDSFPYRSNVFFEVAKIAITAKNQDSTALMNHLKNDNAKIPLAAMRYHGDYESVPTDWIGFNTLVADTYYVAVTDTFGCVYVDSFSVEGPKDKKLEIVDVVPPTEDAACVANNRRIKFSATGGWGEYIFSVKNLDDPDDTSSDTPIEELPEDQFYGSVLDPNYVQDVKYDTVHFWVPEEKRYRDIVTYQSRILNPGRHVISVFDKEFCFATADTILIDAKYTLDGKKFVDWCGDPDNNRLVPIVNGKAKVDSFSVRIGHATIKKDSVEMRHGQKLQTILDEKNNKVSGLGNLPMGKIGVIAYMEDGCSAFNEFTYETRDGFVPLKLVANDYVANNCYDDNTGSVFIDLGGGNDVYTKFELDGDDVYSKYSSSTSYYRKSLVLVDIDKDGAADSSYTIVHDSVRIPDVVNNKHFFKDVNARYTPRSVIEKWAYSKLGENPTYTDSLNAYNKLWNSVKNDSNYVIRFSDLPWGNFLAKDSLHYLVVEDVKGCVDTLKFAIPHPDKLEIEVASSPVCPDGAGRLYAKTSKGGVPPYTWAIDNFSQSEYDKLFPKDNPNKIVPKKPTIDGFVDFKGYDDFKDYYTGYQESDHIPAMEGESHYMFIKDSHDCMVKSNVSKVDRKLTWDEITQDFIVSTWHSYGDVLVIIDKTDYENLKVAEDQSKYAYTYDSMHVEVVLKSPEDEYLIATPQMKELYTYGIPENNSVNSDENQEELIVDWRGTQYVGPMWGIPADVAVTVRTDEEYSQVAEQYAVERGSLVGQIKGLEYQVLVCDSIINRLGRYHSVSNSKVNEAQKNKVDHNKQIVALTDSLKRKYPEGSEYTNTICKLSDIKNAFWSLVDEKEALRMSFVKLEATNKAGNDYVKRMLESKGTLPFLIRTTAYVDGCDITTEHNLSLTFQDSIPYPVPNYKETLTLLPTPNPATNGKCTVKATLNKRIDSSNELYYYLVETDGKLVTDKTKLEGISPVEIKVGSGEDSYTEYEYNIPVDGLEPGKEYIFVAFTKNRIESVKILTK